MRSGYVEINNYQKLGDMGISHRAFETIAMNACNQVNGASIDTSKKRKVSIIELSKPVHAIIRKNGKVDIKLDVILKKGVNVKEICGAISDNVSSSIQMMCETIPFNVEINVNGFHG